MNAVTEFTSSAGGSLTNRPHQGRMSRRLYKLDIPWVLKFHPEKAPTQRSQLQNLNCGMRDATCLTRDVEDLTRACVRACNERDISKFSNLGI